MLQLWTVQPPLAEWIRRGQAVHTPPQRPRGAEGKGRHKGRKRTGRKQGTDWREAGRKGTGRKQDPRKGEGKPGRTDTGGPPAKRRCAEGALIRVRFAQRAQQALTAHVKQQPSSRCVKLSVEPIIMQQGDHSTNSKNRRGV
eukprot:357499-Chlamydomonas_euryale.AAC.2